MRYQRDTRSLAFFFRSLATLVNVTKVQFNISQNFKLTHFGNFISVDSRIK